MTGLNLEGFLHLLRADLGAWLTLGLIALVLALMAWTSFGSRRALRKCLVLSVIAHVGVALYGGTVPVVMQAFGPEEPKAEQHQRIRNIKVAPIAQMGTEQGDRSAQTESGSSKRGLAAFDKTSTGLALADSKLPLSRVEPAAEVVVRPGERMALEAAVTSTESNPPPPPNPEDRNSNPQTDSDSSPAASVKQGTEDVAAVELASKPELVSESVGAGLSNKRITPERSPTGALVEPPMRSNRESLPPASATVAGPPMTASQPIAARSAATGGTSVEPAPAKAAEVGNRDVAAPDVISARPDSPLLSLGDTNLRARSRPGTGSGINVPSFLLSTRSNLDLAMRTTPRLEGVLEGFNTSAKLFERPGDTRGSEDSHSKESSFSPSSRSTTSVADAGVAEAFKNTSATLPRIAPPESNVRGRSRPAAKPTDASATRRQAQPAPLALARVTPNGVPALPEILGATGGRPLTDVPEVYRVRLDPNRSALAFRSGATPASEQAVERALDWLARHQDSDGRWDGATAKYDDGTAVKGDDDFTVYCPAGDVCFGECIYWEADTALTGLALLSYLGAGYTQTDGKYSETVGKGLEFLLLSQRPDGDLRGRSRAVGMYCHAMATIAMCEAYALTGDNRLREPVEKAIDFLVKARARDGLAWRYAPGAPVGDTSILGWVVMALKSAKEVGIVVPSQIQTGTLSWLGQVATGDSKGLARYQPAEPVTPTMTAEAWVCRQFLGVGGPGQASTEAAQFLLAHAPRSEPSNLYYWYYGTLAMYQHGGAAWERWNSQVRDELVKRQRVKGHAWGSWDPDESPYGVKGGRIYCTALATLSLEVYYRYLRLYDDPKIPPALAPARPRESDRDEAVGRSLVYPRIEAPVIPR